MLRSRNHENFMQNHQIPLHGNSAELNTAIAALSLTRDVHMENADDAYNDDITINGQ
jgi:hypothetical protein